MGTQGNRVIHQEQVREVVTKTVPARMSYSDAKKHFAATQKKTIKVVTKVDTSKFEDGPM